jgi:hypothetical protein
MNPSRAFARRHPADEDHAEATITRASLLKVSHFQFDQSVTFGD